MKKTVSITISGIIFNIEEDGYDVLRRYLDTISGYFTQSDGKDEIMADIEARIAELFQERMDDRKMVITAEDVEEVINVMGRPEEYVGEDTEFGSSTAGEGYRRRGSRRVYRDMEGNLIGGVCSGIAHYFGWDPLWIRLIWALLAIGFGFGFLLYIILWIIIPEAKSTSEKLEMTGEAVNVENIKKKK
jgi:phage shock protein PspC (stress-responsive transcriptional regulator)